MAHSGKEPFNREMMEQFKKQRDELRGHVADLIRNNSNNAWPDGMIHEDDEGVTAMAISVQNKHVVIQFPEPTAWIGITPEQAMELAGSLIQNARKAGLRKAFTLEI